MKKLICALLSICMILGVFSGCSRNNHESAQVFTVATTEAATEVTTAAQTEVATESESIDPAGTPGVIKDIENADAVNVRENAGGSYKVVLQIKEGTEITVYEVVTVDGGKEWGRIDQGWICMDFVQLNSSKPAAKTK